MITKKEAAELAEMVRNTGPEAHAAILWAVKYHLALFLWGLETDSHCLEQILLACNTCRDDNIVTRIGLDRLEEMRGNPIIQTSSYLEKGTFISTSN